MAMQADLACPGPALPCLAILEDPSGMLQQGSLERPNTPAGLHALLMFWVGYVIRNSTLFIDVLSILRRMLCKHLPSN